MTMSLLKGDRAEFAFLHGSLFLPSRKHQRVSARLAPYGTEMCSLSGGIDGWKCQGGVTSFELRALSLVWSGIDSANEGCTVCSWSLKLWAGCAAARRGWGSGTGSVCWDVGTDPTPVSQQHWSCSFGELPASWVFPALPGFFLAEIQKLLNTCLSPLCHYNLNCWYKLHL